MNTTISRIESTMTIKKMITKANSTVVWPRSERRPLLKTPLVLNRRLVHGSIASLSSQYDGKTCKSQFHPKRCSLAMRKRKG